MRARFLAAFAILSSAATARADGDVGRACQTSDECGDLHCIDGACVAVTGGHVVHPPLALASSGTRAMFGDGRGYGTTVLVGDLAACAAAGVFVAAAVAAQNGIFAIVALFPTTLTAPIIHLAYGRPVPALISLLAWASVPPTAVFFGALVGLANDQTSNGGTLALATGVGISLLAATGLTALDMYFARDVRPANERPAVAWAPTISPLPGGFTASIVGTF